jgi:hypothetical protein
MVKLPVVVFSALIPFCLVDGHPEDGSDTILRKYDNYLLDRTASQLDVYRRVDILTTKAFANSRTKKYTIHMVNNFPTFMEP